MQKAIIILLIFLSHIGFCQIIEINKAIAPYPNNSNTPFIANSIATFGNDYVIGTVGYDTLNNNDQSVVFFKIDTLGNTTKKIIFSRNGYYHFMHFSTYISSTQDGGYCTNLVRDTNYNNENIIVRLNSNFDTLWTKVFPQETQQEILIQVIEASDKSLVCLGYKEMSSAVKDVLVIKTDSAANILWKKTITLGNFSKGFNITETPDKGFFISGGRGSNAFADSRPFAMKLDSAGNVKWYHMLGNNNLYQGVVSAVNYQGDYVVAYGYSTYTSPYETTTLGRINVIKFNADGYTIWDKIYDTIKINNSVSNIRILPNNNIVVIGSNQFVGHSSFLLSLNSSGDSLAYKYLCYTGAYGELNYIYDNILNADGSITAIGMVQSFDLVPCQQIWLVKTGNLLTTNVSENYLPQGNINISPNPATTQTTITYPTSEKGITLQIYNMLGQLIYEEKLNKGSSQIIINTTTFKRGIYKITLGEYSNTLIINNE